MPGHDGGERRVTNANHQSPHRFIILPLSTDRQGCLSMIDDLWYKNGVFYCLSVGTYMDANGDGVGDFKGLLRRLDYLQDLGVTAIWLMPFQPSPGKDDGYDIADYYGVDPRYGSLGDFVEFTHGCRQRGMRVIIDLVVNHTSNAHPWFRDARSSPDSQYRDWYGLGRQEQVGDVSARARRQHHVRKAQEGRFEYRHWSLLSFRFPQGCLCDRE